MHTTRKVFYVLLFFILLVGCAGAKPKPELCQDESIKRRASMMVGRIAQHADPGVKYYYVVVESNQINAFMDSRKNLVGLTTGLMNAMDDEELAFVVAHEVSHNTLGHYGKKVIASEATTAALRVANVFVPGIGLLNLLLNPAVTNAFSREFELDADRKAAEIVSSSMNVPVEDSMAALLRIKAHHDESSTFILFASHPPIDDRVQNLATSFSVKTDPSQILAQKSAKSSTGSQMVATSTDKKSLTTVSSLTASPPTKKPNEIFTVDQALVKGRKIILDSSVLVREGPGFSHWPRCGTVGEQEGILLGDCNDDWCKVEVPKYNCIGWILKEEVKFEK